MRRLIRAVRAWLRRHFTGHPTPTRAERIVRVGMAAELRWGIGFAELDIEDWNNAMTWHLAMLDDGAELLAWGADA